MAMKNGWQFVFLSHPIQSGARIVFLGLVLLLTSSTVRCEALQSSGDSASPATSTERVEGDPEVILQQFAEHLGGQMELASRTSYQIDCTVNWANGPYQWIVKQDGDNRFTTQQNGAAVHHCDGRHRWGRIGSGGEFTLSDDSTLFRANNSFPHPVTVTRWLQAPEQFTWQGQATITNPETGEDFSVDQVRLQNALGCSMLYSFDQASGMLVHIHHSPDETQKQAGKTDSDCYFRYGTVGEVVFYTDYWFPYQDGWLHIKTDAIQWDVEFPAGTFPPMPKALLAEITD